jgi:AcrR family transcriptional regulator
MTPSESRDAEKAVRPPKQQRSQDTMARIVNAAERLLEERGFDDISVADITNRARSSVGAFYARFADKDALLDYLDKTHAEELIERVTAYSEDDRWRTAPVETLVGDVIGFLAGYFKEHRGVLRALSVRARLHDDPRFAEPTRRVNSRVPELVRLVLSRRSEIKHPSPDLAAYLGFVMVMGTLRERILFPETYPTHLPVSGRLLVDELGQAYLAYLRV